MRRFLAAAFCLAVLSGCGGDEDTTETSPPGSPAATSPTPTATIEPAITGTVADSLAAPWSVIPLVAPTRR